MRRSTRSPAALNTLLALALGAGMASAAHAGSPRWNLDGAPSIGDSTYDLGQAGFGNFEISGIALSRTRADVIWGLEDAGADLIFAFNSAGELVQTVPVGGLASEDLEDISADNEGNLYLADTGTNLRARQRVSVVRLREPKPGDTVVQVERRWTVVWPDAGRDCESMVVHDGYVWLVAKIRSAGQGTTLARFAVSNTNEVITLEVIGDLAVPHPAAGADLTPDGGILAVSTKDGVYSWRTGGDLASAARIAPLFLASAPDTKKEGIAFVPQGLLVATETRDLYLNIHPNVIPAAPPLHVDAVRESVTNRLFWSAPYGVPCAWQFRPALDRGDWAIVATHFPGLGFRTEWTRGSLGGNEVSPGYWRLITLP